MHFTKTQNGFIILIMIYRGRINNIIFEFSPSYDKNKGSVIICDGLPGVPKQKDLINKLSLSGFSVVYPRYLGTWESEGEFLKCSPAQDIAHVAEFLSKGDIKELYSNKIFDVNKPIHLLGSSFGGSVALSLFDNNLINKIIALSPIVDFTKHNDQHDEQDLIWLRSFIKNAFGAAYRFDDKNWLDMVKGRLFNPPQLIGDSKYFNKIFIIYGLEDKEINPNKIKKYCETNKIRNLSLADLGHISFSKIDDIIMDYILGFLNEIE